MHNTRIFVFGTLKQGFCNHAVNRGERFGGRFVTCLPHPLYIVGALCLPWLLDRPGQGLSVVGEVYRVDEDAPAEIDRLERIDTPGWYERRRIAVRAASGGGGTIEPWVYFGSEAGFAGERRAAGGVPARTPIALAGGRVNIPPRALAYVVVLTLLWGTNWMLFPFAVREVSVWTFRAVAMVGSGLVLLVVAQARGLTLVVPRALRGGSDSNEARTLRPLQAAACTYRIAFGPRAGQKVLTVQGGMPRHADFKQALCADIDGFSLHAAVRCGADDRQALERLCRYITRPALANERVQTNAAGQVVLKLKTPWRDGTTHLVMSPLEFMRRLAALVPRPRLHLICLVSA